MAAARYVELNPVRAGLVAAAWGCPGSSARFHMGIAEHDPLVTDRTLLGLVDDWERLLLSSDDGRSSTLRQRTRTGRPAGDAAFVARVEKITGRDLSKATPGRFRKRPSEKK
jgi:putative transposase